MSTVTIGLASLGDTQRGASAAFRGKKQGARSSSGARMLTETEVQAIKPLRHPRKVSDSGGLHLLVTPKGGRRWRFAYRFARKYKTLALGIYPDVSLKRARSCHEFARHLLAHGIDPSALKATLGRHSFAVTLREWEKARGDTSAPFLRSHE